MPSLGHTNEFIGSYVTADARINLYVYLDRLQERALYCNTDSIVYIKPKDRPEVIETGCCLRAMTSELLPGQYSKEFLSGWPKN